MRGDKRVNVQDFGLGRMLCRVRISCDCVTFGVVRSAYGQDLRVVKERPRIMTQVKHHYLLYAVLAVTVLYLQGKKYSIRLYPHAHSRESSTDRTFP